MVTNPSTVPPNSYKVVQNKGTPEEKTIYRQNTSSGYADIDPTTGQTINVVSTQKTATGEKKVNITSWNQPSTINTTNSIQTVQDNRDEQIIRDLANSKSQLSTINLGDRPIYKELTPSFPNILSPELYTQSNNSFIKSNYVTTSQQDAQIIKRSEDYRNIGQPVQKQTFLGKIGQDYEDVNAQLSNIATSNSDINSLKNTFVNGINIGKSQPTNNGRTLLDLNLGDAPTIGTPLRLVQKGGQYVSERPLDIYSSALGGQIFAKGINAIPSITVMSKTIGSSTIKKGIGLGLGSQFAIQEVQGYASVQDKEMFVVGEGIKLGSFGLGSSLASRSTSKNILIGKSSIPKVSTIEGIKSVTNVKDFGGNVLDNIGGKPEIVAGTFESKGGGLYKVNNDYFKLTFNEQGKYVNLPSNKVLSLSESNLDVTKFDYKLDVKNSLKGFKIDKVTIPIKNTSNLSTYKYLGYLKEQGLQIDLNSPMLNSLGSFNPKEFKLEIDTRFLESSLNKSSRITDNYIKGYSIRGQDISSLKGMKLNKTPKEILTHELSHAWDFKNLGNDWEKNTELRAFTKQSKLFPRFKVEQLSTKNILKLNVEQKYNYAELGNSKVSMSSRSVLTPSDESLSISSLSKFTLGKNTTRRFTKGVITPNNDDFIFKGASVDVTNKFGKVRGSEMLLEGKSSLVAEARVGDVTNSIYANVNVGHDINNFKVDLTKSFKKNVNNFHKEQFTSSSESLLGLKSKTINISPQVNEQVIKSVLVKEYIRGQKQSLSSQKFYKAKSIPISNTNTKQVSSSQSQFKLNNIQSFVPKSISLSITKSSSKLNQSLKQSLSSKSSSSFSLKQSNISKTSTKQSNMLGNDLKIGSIVKQDISSKTKQDLKLKQIQLSKVTQSEEYRGISPLISSFKSSSYKPFSLNITPSRGSSKSKSSKSSFTLPKFNYIPTVEAEYFHIKGKRINSLAAESGLVLRPIAG